jgi:4-hydroxy-3-polyprenylbenzoate decarboxylase
MAYRSLGEFLERLEADGDLIRVREPIHSELEIAELTQRSVRKDGPALRFDSVHGSSIPVVTNVLGSPRRIARGLGADRVEDVAAKIADLIRLRPPAGVVAALKDLGGTLATLQTLRSLAPKRVTRAPCQSVEWETVDLGKLPILKTWPLDAARTVTFPVVITSDPETGDQHTGIYRLQQLGPDTLAFHAQRHRIGWNNYMKWCRRGERMPVVASIGLDPATIFAGLSPVPEGVSNFVFAGLLRGEPIDLVKAKSCELELPAESEIVLEGYVDPVERAVEGPFGDHTGYYSAPEPFPVFHVTRVTTRENPVYLGTVTGKFPTEDAVLGKAVEKVFLPVIRTILPEVVDMNLPLEGLFINVAIVSIRKQYPYHARKVMHALWGLGQMMFARYLIIVDAEVDVHDLSEVLYRIGLQADPERDMEHVTGPVDQLSISNPVPNIGAKMGIDATKKSMEEGAGRPWPEEIRSDPEVIRRIDALLAKSPELARLRSGPS